MFDFLVQNKKGEIQSYLDLIAVNTKKLEISKLAIEKAVGMISKAIAKSEFVVERNGERVKDDVYWLLNVRANYNQTATDFWIEVIRKLLKKGECLIVKIGDGMYLAQSYCSSETVIIPCTYSNVTLVVNGKTLTSQKIFNENDVLHLRARNERILSYLEKVLDIYDTCVSALCNVQRISNTPKFKLHVDSAMPIIRRKKEDGTEQQLTIDQYKNEIKRMLESDDIEILTTSSSISLDQFKIESSVKAEEIVKMSKEIYEETAFAFDIPKAVFLGEITEKADSTNEFITYAVSWIVEVINDSLNAKYVGCESYKNGEKIWIDMSRYKHRDIIESAANLDKLRSIGFNFDEIRELIGWEALNTEFSRERVVTKNYTSDPGGGSNEKIEK